MYTKQSKKMLPFNVLDILQKRTDENHRLSQKEIERLLTDQYDMRVDRRSIKTALMELIDMGFDIQYDEISRTVKSRETGEMEEQSILTDFYLERDFSDCEIRLLIDELLDTTYIPYNQRIQLIKKLEGLSSMYFRKTKNVDRHQEDRDRYDNQLFYTMEVIEEAIASRHTVSFLYRRYIVNKSGKIETKKESLTVTPYDMQVVDGEYLLICEEPEGCFKLNYISEMIIADEKKDYKCIRPSVAIEPERIISFVSSENMLQSFIDAFGSRAIQVDGYGNNITLHITTTPKKAVEFALKYSDLTTILSPESVKREVINKIQKGINRYANVI